MCRKPWWLGLGVAAAAGALWTAPLSAQTYTQAASGNMQDSATWSDGNPPSTGSGAAIQLLGGKSLNLNGSDFEAGSISVATRGVATIKSSGFNAALSAESMSAVSRGSLVIAPSVTLNVSNLELNGGGASGNITIKAPLQRASAVDPATISVQGGRVVFADHGGDAEMGMELLGGTTIVAGATGLGMGPLTVGGGVLVADADAAGRQLSNPVITLNGDAAGEVRLGAEGAGSLRVAGGAVNLAGADKRLVVTGEVEFFAGAEVTDGGGKAKFTKAGPGKLTVSSQMNHTGGTVVEAGEMVLASFDVLPKDQKIAVSGGVLNVGMTTQTVAGLEIQGGTVSASPGFGGIVVKSRNGLILADVETKATVDAAVFEDVSTPGVRLQKKGSGTLVLSGENSFSGGVIVDKGTVVIATPGALGSSTSRVELRGGGLSAAGRPVTISNGVSIQGDVQLSVPRSGEMTFDGDINLGNQTRTVSVGGTVEISTGLSDGEGGLVKAGAGRLVLSAPNPSLNGIRVEGGEVLAAADGALGKGLFEVKKGARADLAGTDQSQLSEIRVDGALKNTGGVLLKVGEKQRISGGGSVGTPVELDGGVISAAGAGDKMILPSLSGSGFYQWKHNGRQFSKIVLTGSGSDLSGITLQVVGDDGSELPVVSSDAGAQSLARDSAMGTGRWKGVIRSTDPVGAAPYFEGVGSAVITVRFENQGESVDLVVDRAAYASFGATRRQRAMGNYLSGLLPGHYDDSGSIGALLRRLDTLTDPLQVRSQLEVIQPGAAYPTLYAINLRSALAVGSVLESRLDHLAAMAPAASVFNFSAQVGQAVSEIPGALVPRGGEEKAWAAWASGYASRSNLDAAGGSRGMHADDRMGALGIERQFGGLRVGVLASTGEGNASFQRPSVRVDSDTWRVGGYSTLEVGSISLDTTALFGQSDQNVRRTAPGTSARADFETADVQLGAGAAVNLASADSGWLIMPTARLKYANYSQDAFDEKGTGPLWGSPKVSRETVISKLGWRLGRRTEVSKQLALGIDASAFWAHDFYPAGRTARMRMVGANRTLNIWGRGTDSDTAEFEIGVQATFSENITTRLSGQREVGSNHSQTSGQVSVGIQF
jgi:autotransporter-associated beta strand protein